MAAKKYLKRDSGTGRVSEQQGTITGGSGAQDGDLVSLDSTGRLDPTVMPVGFGADTFAGTAGEALTAGDFVAINGSGAVVRASATSGGFDAVGFVLASSSNGAACTLYFEGRNTALTGLTPGSRYYLSASTPGGATLTPVTGAGNRHQLLGNAITATSLSFEGDDAITLA
jgi:hypothetical protein